MILFATELAQTRAQYLAGVRHRPACDQRAGKPSEWNAEAGPGAKRHPQDKAQPKAGASSSDTEHPVKDQGSTGQGYESTMIWAACCTGFFGFLRCGEFMLPDATTFDNTTHLAVSNISVDSDHDSHPYQKIQDRPIRGGGNCIYLGKTSAAICPVTAMLGYLAIRPEGQGRSLFVTNDRKPVTKRQFIQKVLGDAGIDASGYKSHSFRICGSHHGSRVRPERGPDQGPRTMVQLCIPGVHQDLPARTGQHCTDPVQPRSVKLHDHLCSILTLYPYLCLYALVPLPIQCHAKLRASSPASMPWARGPSSMPWA